MEGRRTAQGTPSTAELCRTAAERLGQAGFGPESARADVAVLARSLLGWDLARWLTSRRDPPPPGFAARLDAWIDRRARHEPVAYITGEREFYGRAFVVTPAVLIPRPDTETLVATALACLDELEREAPVVVDVGTGSGCVAVTLAVERPALRVVATDVSAAALDVARENARRFGVANRIDFREGALLAGVQAPVDLLVSNPPYVRQDETLPAEVASHEPYGALFAGADGLDVIRQLAAEAGRCLAPGGRLAFEIGYDQADAVRAVVAATPGLSGVRIETDIEARPRVVVAGRR